MNPRLLLPLLTVLTIGAPLCAIATETKIDLRPNATIHNALELRLNHPVRLKMRNGDEIRGTVIKVSGNVVHIGRLDGADSFFDAVVAIDAVAAVLVRVRDK